MTLARRGDRASIRPMDIGVIGCGKMATALVAGAVRSGVVAADSVTGYDPSPEAAAAFASDTGASTSPELADLASCRVFLLCTKPHHADGALEALHGLAGDDLLVISIAAGVDSDRLARHAPAGARIIRCMPNTPALVGKGAAAFARGPGAGDDDAALARRLLGSVGLATEVPESLLDAVTGLSGSGPAFVYVAIEALADGGVHAGLPRPAALELAAQTVLGAASMVLETGQHPGALKDMVTSPGGTTIAGLASLEKSGFRAALIDAVSAAAERSAELGRS